MPTDPGSAAGFDAGLLSPVSAGRDGVVADAAIVRALLAVELAYVHAIADLGLASGPVVAEIENAVAGLSTDPALAAALAAEAVADGNPVIPVVRRLRGAVDLAGSKAIIHRGLTSQDVLDSALALVAAEAVRAVASDLDRAVAALADLAGRYRDTLAVARTLTQFAVPTTVGLRFADWLLQLADARDALRGAVPPAQLGGAAGTLSAVADVYGPAVALALPAAFSARLGLPAPDAPWHVRRTPITRLGDALAGVSDALGRIAADVAILGRPEIGELAEPGGGGSSTMPQKRNPVRSVLIRSASLRAPLLAAQLHVAAANAVDERPDGAWHAEWPALRELLRIVLGAASLAAELAEGLSVDEDAVARNVAAAGETLVAERVMLAFEPSLGRESVQRIVEGAARGQSMAGPLGELLGPVGQDPAPILDPAEYLGIAGALVDQALARAR